RCVCGPAWLWSFRRGGCGSSRYRGRARCRSCAAPARRDRIPGSVAQRHRRFADGIAATTSYVGTSESDASLIPSGLPHRGGMRLKRYVTLSCALLLVPLTCLAPAACGGGGAQITVALTAKDNGPYR